jgi:hypothetical protein
MAYEMLESHLGHLNILFCCQSLAYPKTCYVSFQKLSELVNDAYKDAHQRSVQV